LYDLMLNPATMATFERDVPGYAKIRREASPGFDDDLAASFATIATPRTFASSIPISDAELAKLDAIGHRAHHSGSGKTRCARYDETRAELPASSSQRPK